MIHLLYSDDTHSLNHLRQDLQFIAPFHIENLLHLLLIHFLTPLILCTLNIAQ